MTRRTMEELRTIRWGVKSQEERFLSHVALDTRDCWIWTGARNNAGYGVVNIDGRIVLAHRWAFEHWIGPIGEGLDLCHHCDVRACVSPEHHFVGTRRENVADMIAKGRGWWQKASA